MWDIQTHISVTAVLKVFYQLSVELSENPQIPHWKMLLHHHFKTLRRDRPAFAKAGLASPSKPGDLPGHQV